MQDFAKLPIVFSSTFGKLNERVVVAVSSSDPPLLTVAARISNLKLDFLIDTGATVSIIPRKYINGHVLNPTAVNLTSANGQPIKSHGEATINLNILKLRREFKWNFVIADTVNAIIGADFLSHFGLIVDCGNQKLIDKLTKCCCSTSTINNSASIMQIKVNDLTTQKKEVKILLEKFPNLLSPKKELAEPTDDKVNHHIDTGSAKPTFCKTRQLPPKKYDAAKQEFQRLLSEGIVRPSTSPWSSPIHLVPKNKPDEFRICGDYRTLNSVTVPDRYPIPHINSFNNKLYGKHVYSKIDLIGAYNQIPMNKSDISKTAVTTPFGKFEYLFMPFGLRNAGSTFQRFMDQIFINCDFVFIYLDDILIFSDNETDHMKHLNTVFNLLNKNNLKISLNKCIFIKDSLDFLGFNVSKDGIKPTNEKLIEIQNFPVPNSTQSLRRFLGMSGFYRKLVSNFADIAFPLTELIRLNQDNTNNLTLNESEISSFTNIKSALANINVLSFPNFECNNFQLVTDSSSYAVGAALHQMINNEPVPIGFFSKKLSNSQRNYSTFDRELLACYLAVLHFKYLIQGRNVTIFTDHKPLASAFKKQNELKSDRQQRHLSLVTELITDMQYIKGSSNIVADCLSRPVNEVTVVACDLPAIASEQLIDEEIKEYSDRLKSYEISKDTVILCDISTPHPRPFIPLPLRKQIFNSLHSLSHPGMKSSLSMIKSRYFWPNMNRDVKKLVKECESCQSSKIVKHTKSPINNFNLPSNRFGSVHIDIVGPLPSVKLNHESYISPFKYLLTCIDRSTRWIEAVPIADISAVTIAIAFLNGWVSRFGVPYYVITDRGTQFEAELFNELSKLVGFCRLRTTSYRPQTNGMLERAHRTIKTSIIARGENWLTSLPIVLLGIRNTINDSGYSPMQTVTGTSALLPQIYIDPNYKREFNNDLITELCDQMRKTDFNKLSEGSLHSVPTSYVPADLKTCEYVWLRVDRVKRPLEAPYSGPYLVIKRLPKIFIIKNNVGVEQTVSIDRLKPAYLNKSLEFKNIKCKTKCKSLDIQTKNVPLQDSPVIKDTYTTRSGRTVKFRI